MSPRKKSVEREKNLTILIVEDDESIANLLEINLDLAGFKSIIARDGEEAVSLFDPSKIALVLLDLMLPAKDGWEVLEHIQKESEGKVPIIITSAKTQKGDLKKGFEMGIVDYVTKPFDPLVLAEKIKFILNPLNPQGNS